MFRVVHLVRAVPEKADLWGHGLNVGLPSREVVVGLLELPEIVLVRGVALERHVELAVFAAGIGSFGTLCRGALEGLVNCFIFTGRVEGQVAVDVLFVLVLALTWHLEGHVRRLVLRLHQFGTVVYLLVVRTVFLVRVRVLQWPGHVVFLVSCQKHVGGVT